MRFGDWFAGLEEHSYPHRSEWSHYFGTSRDWLKKPEICLRYLSKYLPGAIDSVLIIGCASGKDFLVFDGKYSLFGTDIAPGSEIEWVSKFDGLSYKCTSVEAMTKELQGKDVDMSRVLIFSSGVLMYVNPREQQAFYEACKERGCKNFIFQEYPWPTSKHGDKCLHLGPHIGDFVMKNYRLGSGSEQPCAHINLAISPEDTGKLYEEPVPENASKALSAKDHARALAWAIRAKLRAKLPF
jgi:hypothetical protein